jgi:hypothetical protein
VLIGIQIENGQRVETTVRADTSKIALKRLMAKELGPIKRNAAGQTEELFAIRRQWTYILSTTPTAS